MKKTVFFGGEHCLISWGKYPNGRVSIQLFGKNGPMGTATVNIPSEPLDDYEVIIKSYSENEGMLEALVSAGIVKETGRYVTTGYVIAPVCRLLVHPGNTSCDRCDRSGTCEYAYDSYNTDNACLAYK
jgi:hypothetical protein